MNVFVAVVLVCSSALGVDACDEQRAIDVMSTRVANELGCTMGWQEIIARSGLRQDVGSGTYLKTLCRRSRDDAAVARPWDAGRR